MVRIIYTPHLHFRIKFREIIKDLPKEIYTNSKERYFDAKTRMRIAVGNAKHKGKVREFAVAYERTKEEIKLITIHPLKPHQKQHRIESGRWQQI